MNEVIDWTLAQEKSAGDLEAAKELNRKFVSYLPNTRNKIRTAYENQQLDELAVHVHSLFGAANYCAFPQLLAILETLDRYLADMEVEDPQQERLPELMTQLYQAIEDIIVVMNKEAMEME